MAYMVEVDQSIKVERAGNTVVAFSNGDVWAVFIPSQVKREALHTLRKRGKSRKIANIMLFSICVYLVVEDYLPYIQRITIDEEYTGHDANIRSFLLEYMRKDGHFYRPDNITFERVGKGSPAHKKAAAVQKGRDKEYRRVKLEEILRLLQ